jgi:hypothetical protein
MPIFICSSLRIHEKLGQLTGGCILGAIRAEASLDDVTIRVLHIKWGGNLQFFSWLEISPAGRESPPSSGAAGDKVVTAGSELCLRDLLNNSLECVVLVDEGELVSDHTSNFADCGFYGGEGAAQFDFLSIMRCELSKKHNLHEQNDRHAKNGKLGTDLAFLG